MPLNGSFDPAELVREGQVHRRIYTDPDIFDLEMDRLYGRAWLYVAHESQIPRPGDFVRTRMARDEVLVVRHTDGSIHVVKNSCAHRGARLCAAAKGTTKTFVCPYHAWSFKTDGSLAAIPHAPSYPAEGNTAHLNLKTAPRVESYRGFVFASLAETGPALLDFLGPMTAALDNMIDRAPDGEIEAAGGSFRIAYSGNWKFHHENANDTLHPGFVHESSVTPARRQERKGTASAVDDQQTRDMMMANGFTQREWEGVDLHGFPTGHSFMGGFYKKGLLAPQRQDPVIEDYRRAMVEKLGEARTAEILGMDRFNNLIYPNLNVNAQYQSIRVVHPIAVDKTVIQGFCFRLKGAPEGMFHRAVRFLSNLGSPASMIFSDDLEIFGRVQAGLAAGGPEWLDVRRGIGQDRMGETGEEMVSTSLSELPVRAQHNAWLDYMATA